MWIINTDWYCNWHYMEQFKSLIIMKRLWIYVINRTLENKIKINTAIENDININGGNRMDNKQANIVAELVYLLDKQAKYANELRLINIIIKKKDG